MSKISILLLVGAGLVVGFVFGFMVGVPSQPSSQLSGTNENRPISFDEGIQVDNSFVIDGNGYLVGQASSSATTTLSGSVQIDAFRYGGGIYTASGTDATNASTTLTADQLCSNSIVNWSSGSSANASATLPTAAALMNSATSVAIFGQTDAGGYNGCFSRAGDRKVLYWRNLSNPATSTQFIAGASTTIKWIASSTSFTGGTQAQVFLTGSSTAEFEFVLVNPTFSSGTPANIEVLGKIFRGY